MSDDSRKFPKSHHGIRAGGDGGRLPALNRWPAAHVHELRLVLAGSSSRREAEVTG